MAAVEMETQRKLAASMELKMLQTQINPHFLFNTINTIASFIRTDPMKARTLLREFAVFYRRTLEDSTERISLARELDQVQRYFNFELARFGDARLAFEVNASPALLDMMVPPFLVQPLVENAIKHAMPSEGKLTITVKADADGDDVVIVVSDDGVGMTEETCANITHGGVVHRSRHCRGNVHDRMIGFFGPDAQMVYTSVLGEGAQVTLRCPGCAKAPASAAGSSAEALAASLDEVAGEAAESAEKAARNNATHGRADRACGSRYRNKVRSRVISGDPRPIPAGKSPIFVSTIGARSFIIPVINYSSSSGKGAPVFEFLSSPFGLVAVGLGVLAVAVLALCSVGHAVSTAVCAAWPTAWKPSVARWPSCRPAIGAPAPTRPADSGTGARAAAPLPPLGARRCCPGRSCWCAPRPHAAAGAPAPMGTGVARRRRTRGGAVPRFRRAPLRARCPEDVGRAAAPAGSGWTPSSIPMPAQSEVDAWVQGAPAVQQSIVVPDRKMSRKARREAERAFAARAAAELEARQARRAQEAAAAQRSFGAAPARAAAPAHPAAAARPAAGVPAQAQRFAPVQPPLTARLPAPAPATRARGLSATRVGGFTVAQCPFQPEKARAEDALEPRAFLRYG